MRERNFNVIFALQPLGDNVRHFIIFSCKRTKRFKKDQTFNFLGEGRRVEQAHAATERMANNRERFSVQVFHKTSEICKEILMLITPARGRPFAVTVTS